MPRGYKTGLTKREWWKEYRKRPGVKLKIKIQNGKRRFKIYGFTNEDYEKLLAGQQGVCAICNGKPQGRWRVLDVAQGNNG